MSYTKFNYADANSTPPAFSADDTIKLSFNLKNTGERDGDEVAQVYFRQVHPASAASWRFAASRGFIWRRTGHKVTVDIPAKRFRYWDTTQKKYVVEPGKYELLIGAASEHPAARACKNRRGTLIPATCNKQLNR